MNTIHLNLHEINYVDAESIDIASLTASARKFG